MATGQVSEARGRAASGKRAATVADRIIEDVIELGWPVGHVLGSEGELLVRYQVSRAVFREAVRLLEHQQVARTRRGPSGGLVITEPTVFPVIAAVVLYLHRVDARLDEVFEARILLEEIAAELAASGLEPSDVASLEAAAPVAVSGTDAAEMRSFHVMVAALSRSPALELFIDVLRRVTLLYLLDERGVSTFPPEPEDTHAEIAAAIVSGDVGRARAQVRRHLEEGAELVRARRTTRQLLPESVVLQASAGAKGAEALTGRLVGEIIGRSMRPGDLVGSEAELMEREGVSRALLREAVRLLEHHQIARMRRGPGGGLFVVPPSVDPVTDVVAVYLARRGMEPAALADLRLRVEVEIADLAAARVDAEGATRLRQALEWEAASSQGDPVDPGGGLHAAVATVAQNRVLELMALVLIRLSHLHQVERRVRTRQEDVYDEIARLHPLIAAAVEAGDRKLARLHMRDHLQGLVDAMP